MLKGQHKSPNQSNFEVKDKHNILKGTFSQAQIHPFQYQQNNIQLTGEKMVKKKKKKWRKNLIEQKTNFLSIFLLKGQHKSPNQSNFEVKDKHNILKGMFSQAQIHPFQYQQYSI